MHWVKLLAMKPRDNDKHQVKQSALTGVTTTIKKKKKNEQARISYY